MIEIFILSMLVRSNAQKVKARGRRSGGFSALTVVLWFGMEFVGFGIGSLLKWGVGAYALALVFAAISAAISSSIASNCRIGNEPIAQNSPGPASSVPAIQPEQAVAPQGVIGDSALIRSAFGFAPAVRAKSQSQPKKAASGRSIRPAVIAVCAAGAVVAAAAILLLTGTVFAPAFAGGSAASPDRLVYLKAQDNSGQTACALYTKSFGSGKEKKIADSVLSRSVCDLPQFNAVAYISKGANLFLYQNSKAVQIDENVTNVLAGSNPKKLTLYYGKKVDGKETIYLYREGASSVKIPYSWAQLEQGSALNASSIFGSSSLLRNARFELRSSSARAMIRYDGLADGFWVKTSDDVEYFDIAAGKAYSAGPGKGLRGFSADLRAAAFALEKKTVVYWDYPKDRAVLDFYSVTDVQSVTFRNHSEAFLLTEDSIVYVRKGNSTPIAIALPDGQKVMSGLGISSDNKKLYFITNERELYCLNVSGSVNSDTGCELLQSDVASAAQLRGQTSLLVQKTDAGKTKFLRIDDHQKETAPIDLNRYFLYGGDHALGIDNDGDLMDYALANSAQKRLAANATAICVIDSAGSALFTNKQNELLLARGGKCTKIDMNLRGVSRVLCGTGEIAVSLTAQPDEQPVTESATEPAAEATAPPPKTDGKKLKIAYFVYDKTYTFNATELREAENYALQQYGAEVTGIQYSFNSAESAAQIERLKADGYDMASLISWNPDERIAIQSALQQGMILNVMYNSLQDVGIPQINPDVKDASFQMGKAAAQKWKSANPQKSIVVAVLGWPSGDRSYQTEPFMQGVRSVDPSAKELETVSAEQREAVTENVSKLLKEHPEVNIFYVEEPNAIDPLMNVLIATGRGTLKNGEPTTEVVCSSGYNEPIVDKVFDPQTSHKFSFAYQPKQIARARIDNLMDIYNKRIPQTEQPPRDIAVPSFLIDFWSMTKEDVQEWIRQEYNQSPAK